MRFRSRKDTTFKLITAGYSLLFAILFGESFLYVSFSEDYFIVFDIIILILWILVLWSFFDTSYKFRKNKLIYRSGPRFGTIELDSIDKLLVGKTAWSGKRYATARKGLVIYYENDNQIYISPKTNDSFVEYITKLNPSIEVEIYEDHFL